MRKHCAKPYRDFEPMRLERIQGASGTSGFYPKASGRFPCALLREAGRPPSVEIMPELSDSFRQPFGISDAAGVAAAPVLKLSKLTATLAAGKIAAALCGRGQHGRRLCAVDANPPRTCNPGNASRPPRRRHRRRVASLGDATRRRPSAASPEWRGTATSRPVSRRFSGGRSAAMPSRVRRVARRPSPAFARDRRRSGASDAPHPRPRNP